jgi:hypothetical protein
MNSDNKSPITLENLMRLKRVEQPAPEFWTQFDKELRAKQLTAILEKRRWWHSFPRAYGLVARHPMAMGTAAALVIGLFSVNEFRGNARAPVAASVDDVTYAPSESVAPTHSETAAAIRVSAPVAERPAVPASRMVSVRTSEESFGQELTSMISSRRPSQSLASISSRDETMQIERDERLEAPMGRSLAVINLAAIQAAEPELTRNMLGFSQNFQPAPASDREQITEPLAQMPSPSEERRARLMSEGLPMMASLESAPAPSNDDVMNRLSDNRVYESISRDYDLGANRLSIKF